MKVWARYAVPVMVLVDEAQDTIERIVMVPGERFIDRETMGDMLFYTEDLELMALMVLPARGVRECDRAERQEDSPRAASHASRTPSRFVVYAAVRLPESDRRPRGLTGYSGQC